MAKRAPWSDQDHIHAHIIVRLHVTWAKILGRRGNSRQTRMIDREVQLLAGRAPLYLDEGDQISPSRDKVDFASRRPDPPGKDAPTLQAQPPGRRGLADTTGTFRPAAIPHAFRASARA